MTWILELGAILALVAVNAVLAGAEIAVVTAREARLERRARDGDDGAAGALRLHRVPNRFLSTVQVGITAVAVGGGVFGGARIASTLADSFLLSGLEPRLAGMVALGLVVVLITLLMLVLGELVPKRIALRYPEEIASRLSGAMEGLSVVAAPLVGLLGGATDLVLRLLPLPPSDREEVTEDEIQAMVAQATEAGVLEEAEQEIVDHLFHLSDQTVGRVMTPRERIVWLDVNEGPERWRERLGPVLHTRYLVADGSLDRVVGYVKVQDLLRRCAAGEAFELEPVLREPHLLPAEMPAFRLLELFQWSGRHIGLVEGAEGRIEGLITFHDIVEGILGEIARPHEAEEPELVRRDDGTALADGLLPFEELGAAFGVEPGEAASWDTVHSFVVASLDEPPRTTAVVRWRGLTIEVVDMDGRRVDKVLVSR